MFSHMIFYFLLLSSTTHVSTAESQIARAALIDHWNHVGVVHPPPFLLSKVSTLSAWETTYLARLATHNSLSTINFCVMANLTCSLENTGSSVAISFTWYRSHYTNRDNNGRANMVRSGIFFRESELREGNAMYFPDIIDKLPRRLFLPRVVVSKIPFSMSRLDEIVEIFHISKNSTIEHAILNALNDCERSPISGETKRCLATAEDMVDFAVSSLGSRRLVVHTTKINNKSSYSPTVTIKSVKEISQPRESLSCHQVIYPYLLYYCHSFPKVRIYEVNIMDMAASAIAICHEDTSAWSPEHISFVELGPGPGKIEVCHWIYQNEMLWTIDDK
ncbi:hypothetical protein SAY86_020071 [Trapa natans]|uniref:BURP domain-containing protein n=1 Tax=Trapa natans TaxID=22666 RepID=A0AAN7LYR6_TRANT|nr:hypothetical protein SAY86_020071 [Trapa natans]